MTKETRKKKRKKSKIGIVIILLIVIAGYFLANNQFVRGLYYKINEPISDSNPVINIDNNSSKYLSYKNMLIATKGNLISAYNIKGEEVEINKFSEVSALVSNYGNLNLKACDDYVIAYDKGGVSMVRFSNKNNTLKVDVKSKIIFAKPFNNGEFIVIAEDSSAKNQVILYSNDGKEKYIWHSGVNNIVDASYSSNTDKLVVITSELSTGAFNSKIMFFDISSAAPYSEMTFENTFFTNVNFYNKNNLIVLSDIGTYYFNINGEMVNSYSFDNKMLTCYKQMPDGVMVLSFGSKSGNGTSVEVVGNKGKLISSYECDDDIFSIDADNNCIILCGLRKITMHTKHGYIIRSIEYNKDLQKAFLLKNKFVLIANSEIRIVN